MEDSLGALEIWRGTASFCNHFPDQIEKLANAACPGRVPGKRGGDNRCGLLTQVGEAQALCGFAPDVVVLCQGQFAPVISVCFLGVYDQLKTRQVCESSHRKDLRTNSIGHRALSACSRASHREAECRPGHRGGNTY